MTIYKNTIFNIIPLAKEKQNISENLTSSFRNFQIEKTHFSDSENPFNLDYFAYFSSYYVNFVLKDIITLGKLNKKSKNKIKKIASSGIWTLDLSHDRNVDQFMLQLPPLDILQIDVSII